MDSLVLVDRELSERRQVGHRWSATSSCDGVLRPSGRTAADSAQISLAPPSPIRRHRSRVDAVGRPSRSASHPSSGWTQSRLPAVSPEKLTGPCQWRRRAVLDVGVERELGADVVEVGEKLAPVSEFRERADVGHAQSVQSTL